MQVSIPIIAEQLIGGGSRRRYPLGRVAEQPVIAVESVQPSTPASPSSVSLPSFTEQQVVVRSRRGADRSRRCRAVRRRSGRQRVIGGRVVADARLRVAKQPVLALITMQRVGAGVPFQQVVFFAAEE